MIDRLVLGTVQLGMPYAISNKIGKPDINSACDIVKTAFDQGITRFDTAQAYGDSEEVLGKAFDKFNLNMKVKVYSKLDPNLDLCDADAIQRSVEDSLWNLRIDRLEGLLVHNEESMRFWDKGLGETLRSLAAQGKVGSIGASFYSPSKAFAALDMDGIDMLQVPANILDRRFEDAGVFRKAQERNKKIFVRSIFLQGLLLMPLDCVPASMRVALPYLEQFDQMACGMKLTRLELALCYVIQRWPSSFVLFGAESSNQVADNIRAYSTNIALKTDKNIFQNVPEIVLNPLLWPKA